MMCIVGFCSTLTYLLIHAKMILCISLACINKLDDPFRVIIFTAMLFSFCLLKFKAEVELCLSTCQITTGQIKWTRIRPRDRYYGKFIALTNNLHKVHV